MVVSLGPGKFYGSSLPRPRFYTDIKLNDERVDPPAPVLDPLLSWAEEAHWSMGGLSFKRLRMQGRIEGNVQKLKEEKEKTLKRQIKNQGSTPIVELRKKSARNGARPPAPISKKWRYRSMWIDEEEEEEFNDAESEESEEEMIENVEIKKKLKKRRLVRKLGDDFELVVNDKGQNKDVDSETVASRTRSRRVVVLAEEEEEEANSNGGKGESRKGKSHERKGSVSPNSGRKSNGEKRSGSVSPNGTRSSPRLKQKSI